MKFFASRKKSVPEASHATPQIPLLNCRTPFELVGFEQILPDLVGQIMQAAKDLPKEQNDLYEVAYTAQMIAAYFADVSMKARNTIYSDTIASETDRLDLFKQIHDLLMDQINSDIPYVYETGYLYQGIDSLVLMGSRDAESRYHNYQLYNHLRPEMTLLDVGANCGFLGILAARNLGCRAVCTVHNPYMLDVGKVMARYYGIEDRVSFVPSRIQDLKPTQYDAVFSFASHWTDDGGIRNVLTDHVKLLRSFLRPGGQIFFESHCNDLTDDNYESSIAQVQKDFDLEISFRTLLDNRTRDYIVFQHKA